MNPENPIQDLVAYARRHQASDINIGRTKVVMEIFGRLYTVQMSSELTSETLKRYLKQTISSAQFEAITGVVGLGDGGYADDHGVVRVHAYRSQNEIRIALRLLSKEPPAFESLNLPPIIRTFADYQSGIVLFTGKTGAGKSTALASLIDIMNRLKRQHIFTLEDPIEYVHPQYENSLISQTEVGRDVLSYEEGLRGVLRAAPKVMVFAELRDAVSVAAALQASNSGHLVFSTLHTSEMAETVQRVINYFPPEQQMNIRYQFSQSLKAAVSLRLIETIDGRGRVPACEIFVNTPATRGLLEDPEKAKQLRNYIQAGRKDGMQLLEDNLSELIEQGKIDPDAAKLATNYPDQIASAKVTAVV
jgi:twitching motility protein PilT